MGKVTIFLLTLKPSIIWMAFLLYKSEVRRLESGSIVFSRAFNFMLQGGYYNDDELVCQRKRPSHFCMESVGVDP